MSYLLSTELAQRWGVSKQTIFMLRATGQLPAERRAYHVIMYPLQAVEDFEKTPRFEIMHKRSRKKRETLELQKAS